MEAAQAARDILDLKKPSLAEQQKADKERKMAHCCHHRERNSGSLAD
jgi:hypothetical protein